MEARIMDVLETVDGEYRTCRGMRILQLYQQEVGRCLSSVRQDDDGLKQGVED